MRAVINRALARFDLALIKPSQLASDDEKVRTIVALNQAIKQLENDKLQLGDKLLALSRENEKPRCDLVCNSVFEQVKELRVERQNLRCKVSYWKRKAGK